MVLEYSYRKLKGRIIEKFGRMSDFAEHIGMSRASVSYKLNGKTDFTHSDIIKWCDALEIPRDEIQAYFFMP